MSRTNLKGDIWLASDIHLGPDIPATNSAFYRFLALAQATTQNLILCGDIFDSWIGDDAATTNPAPWLAQAVEQLQATGKQINLYIMCGNRDFLLGQKFSSLINARLLTSPCIIESSAGNILLAHGDEYCTDDISYQRFRKIVRNRLIQAAFLFLPLSFRLKIAEFARNKSKSSRRQKPAEIMDVNQNSIIQALHTTGCSIMIHGHTHRPATHNIDLAGSQALRYVLPDWDFDSDQRGGWISIQDSKITAGLHFSL